jgi:hypothetical protein
MTNPLGNFRLSSPKPLNISYFLPLPPMTSQGICCNAGCFIGGAIPRLSRGSQKTNRHDRRKTFGGGSGGSLWRDIMKPGWLLADAEPDGLRSSPLNRYGRWGCYSVLQGRAGFSLPQGQQRNRVISFLTLFTGVPARAAKSTFFPRRDSRGTSPCATPVPSFS